MAKGTRLPGQGRKSKSTLEKAEAGNPGGRHLTVLDIPDAIGVGDLEGNDMPPVKEYMKRPQKIGGELMAEQIYKDVWVWLKKLNCETIVAPQMIEHYAMAQARYIQCQNAISDYGFLAKHPTTGGAMQSPYVAMGDRYEKQATLNWAIIFQVVKENCQKDFSGPNPNDEMEMLLRSTSK